MHYLYSTKHLILRQGTEVYNIFLQPAALCMLLAILTLLRRFVNCLTFKSRDLMEYSILHKTSGTWQTFIILRNSIRESNLLNMTSLFCGISWLVHRTPFKYLYSEEKRVGSGFSFCIGERLYHIALNQVAKQHLLCYLGYFRKYPLLLWGRVDVVRKF